MLDDAANLQKREVQIAHVVHIHATFTNQQNSFLLDSCADW